MDCRHIRADYTCAAFPDGIPGIIADSGSDHTEHVEGDHGIKFEPRPADEPEPEFVDLDLPELESEQHDASI
jgi:hypothetical protein